MKAFMRYGSLRLKLQMRVFPFCFFLFYTLNFKEKE